MSIPREIRRKVAQGKFFLLTLYKMYNIWYN